MENNFKKHGLFIGIYALLNSLFFMIFFNFLHVVLIWNVFLAFLSIVFIDLMKRYDVKKQYRWLWLWGSLWLLFWPNSFYMITDFIHLNAYQFFNTIQNNPYTVSRVYSVQLEAWMSLVLISLGVFYAIICGLKSFNQLKSIVKNRVLKAYPFFLILSYVLASVAIYIGRFLRFNSWDVLNPIKLMKGLFQNNVYGGWFSVGFIVTMSVLIAGLDFLYVSFLKNHSQGHKITVNNKGDENV